VTPLGCKEPPRDGNADLGDTSKIRDRLPGLKMYKHIYNGNTDLEQKLQSKFVQAYAHFMNFLMTATRLYDGDSMRKHQTAELVFVC
jgi:hypothetical protein